MSSPRFRLPILVLSFVFLLSGTSPALANDPAEAEAEAEADAPVTGASVHAEMLAEHADDAFSFSVGGAPEALQMPMQTGGTMSVDTAQTEGSGGIAALPNGLSHEVFGYLPYWMLGASDLANLRYDLISTIAYFSVGANKDGTLGTGTTQWSGWNSSAMTNVISQAHRRGVRVVLTVTMMAWDYDYRDMTTLLTSSANRARLAKALAATVKARNADGVSLDFEPMPNSLETAYTAFTRELKAELRRVGAGSYLTVATTGGAASWDEGYELVDSNGDGRTLISAGGADALMVMAYDFNYPGSARAGAVAPIDSPYVLDSRDALTAFLRKVHPSKLIWGVPYYGRAWTTTSSSLNGRTCASTDSCQAASWAPRYIDALEAVADHGRQWDSVGRVPWYRYFSSSYNTWVQGYYDDPASLKEKYGLVRNNGLRGAGIWHLGMDGSRRDLWDTLYTQFGPLPFTDISSSKFVLDIVWLADQNITSGCSETAFCPKGAVTRGQMASFLARFLELPATSVDYYDDDDRNKHESNINRLAAARITFGCGTRRFCPDGLVARDQMASFLARALNLPATSSDFFDDDEGNRHEERINRLAASGITSGCGDDRYCPKGIVVREQMAAFLHRASRR